MSAIGDRWRSDRAVRTSRASGPSRNAAAYCAENRRRSPPRAGKQTVFVHGLPQVSPKKFDDAGGARVAALVVKRGIGMAKKVLLVDDSRAVRLICRRLMTSFGFESLEAENGREALALVRSHSDIEVILLDWNMPIMNGLDFLKVLRAERRPLQPAVIMCTMYSEPSRIAEAMAAGASEYLMKPFSQNILLSKFQEVGVL